MTDLGTRATAALNIVHCVRAPIGGIFRNVLDLAEEQSRMGHRVGIVLDSTTGGAFEARKIADAVPHLKLGVTRFPMSRSIGLTDVTSAMRVYRTVAALEPDVLHGHGSKGGTFARLVGTALSRRHRPVARFYSPHGGVLHHARGSLAGRVYFGLERALEHLCDGLIHVSQYEQRQYLEKIGVPRCPATVVVNGLRPAEFEPSVPAPDAYDFIVMGMVRDLKGQDVFVGAIARLKERLGRQPSAAVFGDGPDRETYRRLAGELGVTIDFHDPVPTREGFARCRTMVLPSRAESMPYIALESLAARIPLIATRVGGLPEIFGDDSDALVPAGDPVALADAMMASIADPEALAARTARLRSGMTTRFTVSAMTAAVEAIYARGLAARGLAADRLPRLQPAE